MDGFKDRAFRAEIGTRHKAQPADERRTQIADDIAVKILKQQRVVLVGIHYELHARIVDDVLTVKYFGKLFRDFAGAAQEKPIRKLHDVGLVDGVDLLPTVFARVLKGEFRNARRTFFRDHLDAFDHARNHLVLQAHILALGVFAHNDQVHAGPLRLEAG